ncbi:MAG: hypothetical protein IKV03_02740 [Alphaproteobacteria bacterium]|nr:hypothetical protein [Alphaproteobacteria bacterium]
MFLLKAIISGVRKYFKKAPKRDLSDCFAPMTVVYRSGYEAFRKGWKE